jgi:hypothetical protein
MKSNRTTSFFKHSLPAVLSACLFLGYASAQPPDAVGKFTLPFEARWGKAVLPAGNYSFTVSHTGGSPELLAIKNGSKAVALVMASGVRESKPSNDNTLVAVRNGGQHSIQLLKLGCIGQTFFYQPAKGAKPSLMAEGPRLVERVPITVAGE